MIARQLATTSWFFILFVFVRNPISSRAKYYFFHTLLYRREVTLKMHKIKIGMRASSNVFAWTWRKQIYLQEWQLKLCSITIVTESHQFICKMFKFKHSQKLFKNEWRNVVKCLHTDTFLNMIFTKQLSWFFRFEVKNIFTVAQRYINYWEKKNQ